MPNLYDHIIALMTNFDHRLQHPHSCTRITRHLC